ncbi:hypothetical protein SAMN04487905_101217 [Actinopolyspora xinjiangensis]|uniref:Uncharacterized protein n=1 Tax=Actinopolyspora xinjiangensis TaxID=405564 RepID=A0A1H0NQW6_9ACTN|nr:hypothetical protein SAMN04487905_101217 [Actinopolyspora xinjiangensis]
MRKYFASFYMPTLTASAHCWRSASVGFQNKTASLYQAQRSSTLECKNGLVMIVVIQPKTHNKERSLMPYFRNWKKYSNQKGG